MIVYQVGTAGENPAGAWNDLAFLPASWSSVYGYIGQMKEELTPIASEGSDSRGGHLFRRTGEPGAASLVNVYPGPKIQGVDFWVWLIVERDSGHLAWWSVAYVGYAVHVRARLYRYRGKLPQELLGFGSPVTAYWVPGAEERKGLRE